MKKVAFILIAAVLTVSAQAQKDSTKPVPVAAQQQKPVLALIGEQELFDFLIQAVYESNLTHKGKPLSPAESITLIQWLNSRKPLAQEEPKKK